MGDGGPGRTRRPGGATAHDQASAGPAGALTSKYLLLASLYLSQGLPYGFFTQALPVLLRERGASLPEIGLANLLALPWVLKFLWAPLVDRRAGGRWGRRRGFILPIQLATVGVLLFVATIDPTRGMTALLAAVLLTNLLAATQDIGTDALAVDLLRPEERGLGNGLQVAAYRGGMILGGGAILLVFDRLGWARSFGLMALILLVATVPLATWTEPPPATRQRAAIDWAALGAWWRRTDTAAWILLLAVWKAGEAMATAMIRPLLVDAGLGMAEVGWLMGTVGSAAGLAGALVGGLGARLLGRRPALVTFGIVQAAAVAGWAWTALHPEPWLLELMCGLEQFASGTATVALFTVMMDAARPERAATDYTVQACAVVGATGLAAAVSGVVAQSLGYPLHFAVCAGISLLGVGLVLIYRPRGGGFVPRLDVEQSRA